MFAIRGEKCTETLNAIVYGGVFYGLFAKTPTATPILLSIAHSRSKAEVSPVPCSAGWLVYPEDIFQKSSENLVKGPYFQLLYYTTILVRQENVA